mmetsp:Transcript_14583/g.29914  ORF Transcript_14583/g.29914 Transcript_14583/m.29914 type:complete len:316 (+) Transcript_14583:65-1012(+)
MASRLKDAASQFSKRMPSGGGSGPEMPGGPAAVTALRALIAAGAIAVGAANCFYTVDAGQKAVIFNRITGVKQKTYPEGLNFNIPWFEYPTVINVRTKAANLTTKSGTNDLQMVTIGIRVLHRPDIERLPFIYQRLGTDYDERILPSIINEVAKAVVARFNASDLITKRDAVSMEIRRELEQRASYFHVLLEDVAVTHLTFSPEYSRAVESKQVAEQDAQRAAYVVVGAKAEKQTIITKAKGQAEATELIGNAVKKNPAFMKLRKIDAAKEIAETVSKSPNKIYLNADSLLLNLMGDRADEKIEGTMGKSKRGWW